MSSRAQHSPSPSEADVPLNPHRTPRDYYILLRERLWVVLPFAALIGFIYGFTAIRSTRMYSATATLQFEKPRTVVTNQGVFDPAVHSETDLNTNLEVLASRSLRERVARSLTRAERATVERPWRASGASPPDLITALGTVESHVVGGSYLIAINVLHRDAYAAALVANAFAREFIRQQQDELGGVDDLAVAELKNRVRDLQAQSELAQQLLDEYVREHDVGSLEKTRELIGDNLKTVNASLMAQRLSLATTAGLDERSVAAKDDLSALLAIDAIISDPEVAALRQRLDQLQMEEEDLSQRYLELHPAMQNLRRKIDATRKRLLAVVRRVQKTIHTRAAGERDAVSLLEREYAELQARERNLDTLNVRYESLRSEAAAARSAYAAVLDRLTQTQTTKTLESVPLHLVDAAVPNLLPITANRGQILRRSAWLGIVAFCLGCLALSSIDDRVKSSWDVEKAIGGRLLGVIPRLSAFRAKDYYVRLCEGRPDPAREFFLNLYSATRLASTAGSPRILLVTSTAPGEGKTLIAANLGNAYAHHGKRVLLVDGDLRRPALHRCFHLPNDRGIAHWAEAGSPLGGPAATIPALGILPVADHLWLLRSGGEPASPTKVLENPAFGALLQQLKSEFDLVVLDTPPMGAATDALLMAAHADESIYVCRFNFASRRQIRLHVAALQSVRRQVLGLVLNRIPPSRISYYSDYRTTSPVRKWRWPQFRFS